MKVNVKNSGFAIEVEILGGKVCVRTLTDGKVLAVNYYAGQPFAREEWRQYFHHAKLLLKPREKNILPFDSAFQKTLRLTIRVLDPKEDAALIGELMLADELRFSQMVERCEEVTIDL